MGKRHRNRNRKPQQQHAENKDERKPYQDIIRENEAFIIYYKTQEICKNDWDEFLAAIKTDLPSTFRITASKNESKALLNIVKEQFSEERATRKVFPLPWYPNDMAWQLGLTRKDIRRNEEYYRLHNFLISETQNGTINRQETVSMIPPLVLNVKSEHKVLDMCAAPGSKTAQLIEMLHADESLPTGYVIANDIDNNRCYMLVHQAKRLNSPCIAVTNHNSQFLPNMFTLKEDGSREKIEFDRILCDVPCSGDGTLRKNPDIWMKWTPANGLNQHGVQFRIARRGAELLKIGGLMVYSTCSLNPIENEAVVHRLLLHCNGGLELVDVGLNLNGLKYAPGMEEWKVSSRHLEFYKTFEEVDEKWKTTIRPSFFPPKPEDRHKFNLKKCIRIMPHYQDTGAFFVAVFKKTAPIIHKKEKPDSENNEKNQNETEVNKELDSEEKVDSENNENNQNETEVNIELDSKDKQDNSSSENEEEEPNKRRKLSGRKKKASGYREDPFVFFKDDELVWSSIKDFYDISANFDPKCLLTRCHVGKKKNIYYCSPALRDVVLNNQSTIKFINTGVKTFVRSDNRHMKCAFRLAHEGLESIINHIKMRIINITKVDLLKLLANTDPQKSPEIVSLTQPLQDQVKDISPGSCVLRYFDQNKEGDDRIILNISGWRGTNSLRCYVTDFNAVHYLRLLGGDVSKYDINKFKKNTEEDDETMDT